METVVEVPEKVSVSFDPNSNILTVKGPRGEVKKKFLYEFVKLELTDGGKSIRIYTLRDKRNDKAVVGTWESIIKSLFIGVTKGFVYTMKIVYAHFPVKVTVKGDEVTLDNFLGEKSPRKIKIDPSVKVMVKGDTVTLEGNDLELLGNTAAKIERLSKIKNFDPRVFQDGIYIVRKGDVLEA